MNRYNGMFGSTSAVDVNDPYFDGTGLSFLTDDYVGIPHSSDLKPTAGLTIQIVAYSSDWVNYTTNSRLISCTESGGWSIALNEGPIVPSGYIGVLLRRNNSYGNAKVQLSTLSVGWHLFTARFDGRYLKLFIDGILLSTDDAGGIYPIQYSYNNSIMIGAEAYTTTTPSGNYFTGKQAIISLYNRALTDAELAQNRAVIRQECNRLGVLLP